MSSAAGKAKRILVAAYIIGLHLIAVYFVGEKVLTRFVYAPEFETGSVADPTEKRDVPTPLPIPSTFADAETPGIENSQPHVNSVPGSSGLIIPVAGVRAEQLTDSFSYARGSGRVHDAIDIMAPAGTPVIAAADGEIVKFFDSIAGGITIYQLSADRKFTYYYAHLQRRVEDIKIGDTVKQGRTIGFVGDTGNAGAGNYHLHFSIAAVTDPKRYWEGVYINPYPLLKNNYSPKAK